MLGQNLCGPPTHYRRPALQRAEQLSGRKRPIGRKAVVPGTEASSCHNGFAEFYSLQGILRLYAPTGHEQPALREKIGEQKGASAIPARVLVLRSRTARSTLVRKAAIVATVQVQKPALLL